MTTALLLSSAFGDMGNGWVVTAVIASSVITLVVGLILIGKDRKEN